MEKEPSPITWPNIKSFVVLLAGVVVTDSLLPTLPPTGWPGVVVCCGAGGFCCCELATTAVKALVPLHLVVFSTESEVIVRPLVPTEGGKAVGNVGTL